MNTYKTIHIPKMHNLIKTTPFMEICDLYSITLKGEYPVLSQNKAKLVLHPIHKEIIIGCLLGDAYASRPTSNHNTRLEFRQGGEKHKLYIYWLESIFSIYIKTGIKTRNTKYNTASYSFNTLSFPQFNIFKDMFYDKYNKKRVPIDLKTNISAISLAFWFMDDGTTASRDSKAFVLNTQGFNMDDTKNLISILYHKFGINSNIRKEGKYNTIYIPVRERDKWICLIKEYMHPSMYYKLSIV